MLEKLRQQAFTKYFIFPLLYLTIQLLMEYETWKILYYICSHINVILQSKYLKLIYNKTYHLLYPNTTIKKKWKSWKKKRVRINKKLLCKFEIFSGLRILVFWDVMPCQWERNVSIFYSSGSMKKQHSITSQKTGI
jgi:hypothetical protein